MGNVHPSEVKLSTSLRCSCRQLGPTVSQVDPPGSYPVLQPVVIVQLGNFMSENPVGKSVDRKNVRGS